VEVRVESVSFFVDAEKPHRIVKWKVTRRGGELGENIARPLADLAANAEIVSVSWEKVN